MSTKHWKDKQYPCWQCRTKCSGFVKGTCEYEDGRTIAGIRLRCPTCQFNWIVYIDVVTGTTPVPEGVAIMRDNPCQ